MKTVDLLDMIHRGNTSKIGGERVRGKLVGYRYYGYVSEQIKNELLENYLKRLKLVTGTDKWVSLEIVAVGSIKEIAKSNENTSFAYGNIAVLAPSNLQVGDWYQVEGQARTVLYDGTGDFCYISDMVKTEQGWCVAPPNITDLDLGAVSNIIMQHIEKSVTMAVLLQPKKPESYDYVRSYRVPYSDGISTTVRRVNPEALGIEITDRSDEIKFENDLFDNNYVEVDSGLLENEEKKRKQQEEERREKEREAQRLEKERIENIREQCEEYIKSAGKVNSISPLSIPIGGTLADSIDWSKVKSRPNKPFKAVTRMEMLPRPERIDELEQVLDTVKDVMESNFENNIKSKYELLNNDIMTQDSGTYLNLIKALMSNINTRPFGTAMTGSAVIREFIDSQEAGSRVVGECTMSQLLQIQSPNDIYRYMLGKASLGDEYELSIPMTEEIVDALNELITGNIQEDFAGLYAVLTSMNVASMKKTAQLCNQLGISFIQIVKENPYILLLVNSKLKFLSLETLANARGVHNKHEDWRLAGVLSDFLKSSAQAGNTAYDVFQIYKKKLSMSVGVYGVKRLREDNSLVSRAVRSNILAYIDSSLTDKDWNYNSTSFNDYGKMIFSTQELKKAIIAYVNLGLGYVDNGVLYSTRYLNKELEIINKLYEMHHVYSNYTPEKIDKYIKEFEAMKARELKIDNYALEDEQKNAVRLVVNSVACVTGPAGSGKTTTSEAMVYVLKKLGGERTTVQYAAPTGKAAKRLQEVVGGNVRTTCSLFNISLEDKSELLDLQSGYEGRQVTADVFFLDEQAMADLNQMYNVIMSIPLEAQLFLLGDKDQLVPIGAGKPFLDFTRFLPTVVLKVSKRSAEGSQISKNMKLITEHSEPGDFIPTENGDDFRKIPMGNSMIVDFVVDICKYHIGKGELSEDYAVKNVHVLPEKDIQVVCPVVSEKFEWNSTVINEKLQNLFNPMSYEKNSAVTFGRGDKVRTLRKGSRVIWTSNDYTYRHYDTYKNGVFTETNDAAIMNGDVGYIVDIIDAERCRVLPPVDEERETEVNGHELRKPELHFKKGYIVVVVEFYNADKHKNYYILFVGRKSDANSTMSEVVLSSGDLGDLLLAYCLTTHKMQGSENKLIIFACGSGLNTEFLNRNHVYTAESRARLALYEVGDTSAIEYARHFEGASARTTTMGYAYE